ncbi:hypothetical protein BKA65DRAFT_575124 [Rhexocercosporidium sp. MPI-PUGE-AT-0058]|nr:hypothetical protein BKA65DRAFT_575124 [Rhexocercosporidium sp. MPI-PUGE-AT-0058]
MEGHEDHRDKWSYPTDDNLMTAVISYGGYRPDQNISIEDGSAQIPFAQFGDHQLNMHDHRVQAPPNQSDEQRKQILDRKQPIRVPQGLAYHSLSNNHRVAYPMNEKRRGPATDSPQASRMFQCTRINLDGIYCLKETLDYADWQLHEETHWPQKEWECLAHGFGRDASCYVCGVAFGTVRNQTKSHDQCLGKAFRFDHDFHLKDELIRHLKDHYGCVADVENWYVDIEPDWEGVSGFCGAFCMDWESRCVHVSAHFTAGLRMLSDWKDPWPDDPLNGNIFGLPGPDNNMKLKASDDALPFDKTPEIQQPVNSKFHSGIPSKSRRLARIQWLGGYITCLQPPTSGSLLCENRRTARLQTRSFMARRYRLEIVGTLAQLKPEDGMANDMWDSTSIASIMSGFTGETFSSINPAAVGGAVEEVVSVLARKDEIRHLIIKGFQMMDLDKFERNFRRLLRDFANNLRIEANQNNVTQMGAIKLVYTYRAHATRVIRQQFACSDIDKLAKAFHEIKNRKVDKIMLERLLIDEQSDFGSGFSDNEGIPLPNLERVREFLTLSDPFKKLERSLALFLDPTRPTAQNAAEPGGSATHEENQILRSVDIAQSDPETPFKTEVGGLKKRAMIPSNDTIPSKRKRLEVGADSNGMH